MNFAQKRNDLVSQQTTVILGLGGMAVAILASQLSTFLSIPLRTLLVLLSVSLPMALASICLDRTYERDTSGLSASARPICWVRVAIKCIGLFGTAVVLLGIYRTLPLYSGSFYQPVWKCAMLCSVPFILAAPIYIAWVDCRMREPEDELYSSGLFFTGRWSIIDWPLFFEHVKGWMVKGFFVPFMVGGLAAHLSFLGAYGVRFESFQDLYASSLNLLYLVDVVFGAIGYLLCVRVLDAHIRSVEPTFLGWAVTLICYPPVSYLRKQFHLSYSNHGDWQTWLVPHPVIFVTWGFAILLLHIVYVWSTASFGCRFSNLTNRGIITSGPFRWFKHPAYLSKNIAWWLMFVPFLAHASPFDAILASLSLGFTNLIYFMRAKTEENHLLHDPAYRVYSRWITRYGVFAQMRQLARRMLGQSWKPVWIPE